MDSIAQLDTEIEYYLTQVMAHRIQQRRAEVYARELKSHRNNMQPISRLPIEVLLLIFAECLHNFDEEPEAKSTFGWIQITGVCSRWRQVAISHSLLWRNITESLEEEWAITFIARSAPGPFNIDVNICDRYQLPPFLLQNISRVRSLRIAGDKTGLRRFVKCMSSEAPWLEHIRMVLTDAVSDTRCVQLPNYLFNKKAPHWTILELGSHVTIPDKFTFLPQLKMFCSLHPLSISVLHQKLSRLTSAYRLQLLCSPDYRDQSVVVSPLHLPNVKVLYMILEKPMKSISLFQSLALPSLSSLTLGLELDNQTWGPEDICQLLTPVSSRALQVNRNEGTFRELHVDHSLRGHSFSFRAIPKAIDILDPPSVSIHIDWSASAIVDHSQTQESVVVPQILNLFYTVEILVFFPSFKLRSEVLKCANPQRYEPTACLIIDARSTACFLPLLRKLVFKDHRIRPDGELLRDIRDFVMDRRRAGIAIQEIDFIGCEGDSAAASTLQELVKVTWSGNEIEP